MANENGTQWTPEQKIQRFKEYVTAILGILILACTLFLAILTFGYVGETTKITDAKDILQVLLAVAGVVVGYYFGRVPADARAAQAQEQANEAAAQTEQISTQAQEMSDQVDQVMDKISPSAAVARGGQPPDALVAAELQTIRDKLRALATKGRRRS
jgi:hypothetical protein